MKNPNELEDLANELEAYLDLKLDGFRREYPEDHCVVQSAVRLREKVRANAKRMAAAATLAEALIATKNTLEMTVAGNKVAWKLAEPALSEAYAALKAWKGANPQPKELATS